MRKPASLSTALGLAALALANISISPAVAAGTSMPLPIQGQPLAPEANPPGDIPDTQVFVDYQSPLGFALQVPESWARSTTADSISFVDKFDSVRVTLADSAAPPTVGSAREHEVPELTKAGHAVQVGKVESVKLPAGAAVRIAYTSNSEPNPVTSKAIRLENDCYLFWHKGKLARVTMSAPAGADNVDQWRFMAEHFRWQ